MRNKKESSRWGGSPASASASLLQSRGRPALLLREGEVPAIFVRGQTEEEVLQKAAEHAKQHGLVEVTPALATQLRGLIKEE